MPSPNELRRLRRKLPRPPRLPRARRVSHPSDHDPGTTQFFKGSVACMASTPTAELCPALATALVDTAFAVFTSDRPASRGADALSVKVAWTLAWIVRPTPDSREPPRPLPSSRPCGWPTTKPPTPSSGRTPEDKILERNRAKQRRSDSCDSEDRTRAGGGKDGGGGDHHHRRGGDSVGGGARSPTGAGGVSGRRRGGNVCRNYWSQSSGGGRGGRRNGARGR